MTGADCDFLFFSSIELEMIKQNPIGHTTFSFFLLSQSYTWNLSAKGTCTKQVVFPQPYDPFHSQIFEGIILADWTINNYYINKPLGQIKLIWFLSCLHLSCNCFCFLYWFFLISLSLLCHCLLQSLSYFNQCIVFWVLCIIIFPVISMRAGYPWPLSSISLSLLMTALC